MNSSPLNYITVNQILADVLKLVQDGGFKKNSRGYYVSQIQQALEELSFDTFFDKRSAIFDVPENFRLELPKGAFNLNNIYLFNGDECTIDNSTPVYYKSNFINAKGGNGYVANNKGNNGLDPFYKDTSGASLPRNLYFYSIQNGVIMLSSNCLAYRKVFIDYNGTGGDIGEAPFVPTFLRQAVKGYVTVNALESIVADSLPSEVNKWASLLSYHKGKLEDPFEGQWVKAERRIRKLDFKQRRDIKERMQKMDY